jgi:hypothetical protein
MAKAQGKKAAAAGSKAAKKVVARVKSAPKAAKKKVAAKKTSKPAPKKPAPKKPAPKAKAVPKPAKKAAKPVKKVVKAAAKAVKAAVKKVVAKVKAKPPAKPAAKPAAKPVAKAPAKPVKPPAKPAGKPEKAAPKLKAVKPSPAPAPVAPNVPAVPKAAKPEAEKKRGRRARPRVLSNGAPAASWLSSEKPRPASFIAAPARAEAPSAVAAPPASSDRLIREDDMAHPAVRTVPVRIDVEQGAGRFYVIANPMEVSVRVSEGIEWDFRYLGGADVNVEEIVIELEKPSPFTQAVFRTRKPGGARPHRQMSGGALPGAAGKRMQYTVRAINQFKMELANTKVFLNVTA